MASLQYPRLLPPPLLPVHTDVTSPMEPATSPVASVNHTPLHCLPPAIRSALTLILKSGKKRVTKEFLALCEYSLNPALAHEQLQAKSATEIELLAMNGVKKWCTKRIPSPTGKMATSRKRKHGGENNSHRSTRSGGSTYNALLRDNSRCVPTNRAKLMVEVTHIFPISVHPNPSPCLHFLTLLRAFAGVETAGKVAHYLGLDTPVPPNMDQGGGIVPTSEFGSSSEESLPQMQSSPNGMMMTTDSPSTASASSVGLVMPADKEPINCLENLLTLSGDAHKLFGKGIIILEPIGDPLSIFDTPTSAAPNSDSTLDNPTTTTPPQLTTYDILFSYLPSHPTTTTSSAAWDLTSFEFPNTPLFALQHTEETDPDLAECMLVRIPSRGGGDGERGQPEFLRTGTRVTLSTKDAVRWPLPHPDLLRLHAGLSRVVRCAGAGAAGAEGEGVWEEEEQEAEIGGASALPSITG